MNSPRRTRSPHSPRGSRSPLRGSTRPSVVKLDPDAVGTMLQAARHAEEIHTLRKQHAMEMAELHDRMRAAEAERQRWEARSTQLVARLEQEQLRLASLKLAERMHGSAVDASRVRADSMTQRLADAGELVRQAELQAASHRALQLAAQDEAAAAQAELRLLRQQASTPTCDLIALPALRLEDPNVRPPSSDEWVARFSARFGRWYWYHTHTSETRWNWPPEVLSSAPGRQLHAILGIQLRKPLQCVEAEVGEGVPRNFVESTRAPSRGQEDQDQKQLVPAASSVVKPCDNCATLRRKVRKLTRKLRETEAQKKEMCQKATALQKSVAAFEVELEDTIQKIVEGIEEHYEVQIDSLRREMQAMAVSSRRDDRERERLERQLQLQEDEYVVLVERTNSFGQYNSPAGERREHEGSSELLHVGESATDEPVQPPPQPELKHIHDELGTITYRPAASVNRARQSGKSPPTRLRGPRGKRSGRRLDGEAARAKATGNLKKQLAGLRRASMEMDSSRMLAGLQQQSRQAEHDAEEEKEEEDHDDDDDEVDLEADQRRAKKGQLHRHHRRRRRQQQRDEEDNGNIESRAATEDEGDGSDGGEKEDHHHHYHQEQGEDEDQNEDGDGNGEQHAAREEEDSFDDDDDR